jgi:hypothetical protein
VGLKSLKSLNLTNGYPNKNKKKKNNNNNNNNNNNKVKSKPLEFFELAGKKSWRITGFVHVYTPIKLQITSQYCCQTIV